MHPVVRSFLLWLLALALPVQGFAAATMVHCAGTHRQAHALVAPNGDPQSEAGTAAHAHGGQVPVSTDDAAASASAHRHAAQAVGGTQCSVCAACCVPVGLPPAAVVLAESPVAMALHAPQATPLPSAVPERLERPPRAVLA